MKYLVKVADAEERWAEQAKLIQAGKKKSMLSILEERGLVEKFTGSVDSHPHCASILILIVIANRSMRF